MEQGRAIKKKRVLQRRDFQLCSHQDMFRSKVSELTLWYSCVILFQGQVKAAETGGATIMKERLLFSSRLRLHVWNVVYLCQQYTEHPPNPFMRYSITQWNTFLFFFFLNAESKYSGWSALPGPWVGLHAYCAGSMVKFKLGWLVKLSGAFSNVCCWGALPLFDLPLQK